MDPTAYLTVPVAVLILLVVCPPPPVNLAAVPAGWTTTGRRAGVDPAFSLGHPAEIGGS